MLCQSLPPKPSFVIKKKIGAGSIFCVLSIASILIGKDEINFLFYFTKKKKKKNPHIKISESVCEDLQNSMLKIVSKMLQS